MANRTKKTPSPVAQKQAQQAFNQLNKNSPGAATAAAPGTVYTRNKLVIKNQLPEGTILRGVSGIIGQEYQAWGPDNRYPDVMLEAIRGSKTAAVCINTKAKFIKADGFADADFYQLVVNRMGLKMDNLLGLHSSDLASLYGVASILNFNAWGHPCEVLQVPFSQWRPGVAGEDGVVRTAWLLENTKALKKTNSLTKTKAKKYTLYNPSETPAERIARIEGLAGGLAAYPGEVHIYFHKTTGALNHPTPLHDAVVRDMISEAALTISRGTDIRNAFSAQTMVTEYGTASPSKEKLEADAEKYGEVVGEDGVRLIVQYAQDKATKPDVDTFQVNNASDRYKKDGEALKADIRAIFLIPNILYGESQNGGLGHEDELEQACKYVQKFVVNEDQRALELYYQELFQDFWPIGQTAPGIPILPEKRGQPSPGIKQVENWAIQPLSMVAQDEVNAEPTQEDKVLGRLTQVDALVANQLLDVLSVEQKLRLLGYPETEIQQIVNPGTAAAGFKLGDSVMVREGMEHMPEHAGVSFEITTVNGTSYGVTQEGKPEHKWYTAEELMSM